MWNTIESLAENLIEQIERLQPPSIDRLCHRLERRLNRTRDDYFESMAEAWGLDRCQKISERLWPLFEDSKNQGKSAADFATALAVEKEKCSRLGREMANLKRPAALVLLLRTLLWTLPEKEEAPEELMTQLEEIHKAVQSMVLKCPNPSSIERNTFDQSIPPLVERTVETFESFESYYRSHPDDPEIQKFNERVDVAIVVLSGRSPEVRKDLEFWSNRLEKARTQNNDDEIEKALARTADLRMPLDLYDKVIEVLCRN